MAIDGFTIEQYKQLLVEIRGAGELGAKSKRKLRDSSSEVPVTCSKDEWTSIDPFG